MLCLKGYKIPRRDKYTVSKTAARSGQSSAYTDSDIDKSLMYSSNNSKCCIYCKNWHHPDRYCFRLKTDYYRMSFKRKKRSRRDRDETDSSSSSESSEESKDARDSSEHYDTRSGESDRDDAEEDRPAEDKLGPPFGSLEGFYDGKKRIDSFDVNLVLRPETIKMYFDKLLADGKMDHESARSLHKKYFMADKEYKKIAPPSLSATKLHEIQSHDLGGVHSRLMGIHVSMRSALKIILRSYESIGGVSNVFSNYKPVKVYSENELNDRFVLPSRSDLLADISEGDVEQEMPIHESDVIALVKEKIMLKKLADSQAKLCVDLLKELDQADTVACLGQKQQILIEELLWDGLQHLGQLDLTIKDAREAKIEEYLTSGFKSSLKAANRDRIVKSERHKKDVLLHPKLDKMVKEEARANSKVGLWDARHIFHNSFYFRSPKSSSHAV